MTNIAADAKFALQVRNLRVSYRSDNGPVEIVHGIDLDVLEGKTLGLVGESGSGKSITGKAVMGLLGRRMFDITADKLEVAGTETTPNSPKLTPGAAMIFQNPFTSLNPSFTVGDFLTDVIRHRHGLKGAAAKKRALELLDAVRIPDAARKLRSYPHQMSGGQQQRVVIAVALALEPRVLIADEPTTALDVTVQAKIIELLNELQKEHGMGMVFVSHDLSLVSDIADSVAVMYRGKIVERGDWGLMTGAAQHPYTKMLLASSPSVRVRSQRLSVSWDFEEELV